MALYNTIYHYIAVYSKHYITIYNTIEHYIALYSPIWRYKTLRNIVKHYITLYNAPAMHDIALCNHK